MNDFDYDAMCKKRIARNAFNHVNARRGKCKLPHEYLTRKELNALNGEVKTYDLGKPMKHNAFRKLPDDLQKKYLESLQERFHANDVMLSQMLGCSRQNVLIRRKRLGIKGFARGSTPKEETLKAWETWLAGGAEETDSHVAEAPRKDRDEPAIKPEETKLVRNKAAAKTPVADIQGFRVVWENVHSWEELYAMAKQFPFPGRPAKIRLDLV